MSLHFEALESGPFRENTWIVGDPDTGDAILVDPGAFDDTAMEDLAARLAALTFKPLAVVNTHGHIDHIAGVQRVKDHFGIPFYIHHGEKMWLEALPQQCAMFGVPAIQVPKVDHWLKNEQTLGFGSLRFKVSHVPGHTRGGCALLFEGTPGHALVGDTLFAGSVGRTDFPDGDPEQLASSIRTKLYELDPETVVHTGHGPDTTIGQEREHNPFVRA